MTREGSRTLISVIMPVWRPYGPWLLHAVGSVLGQDDCTLELIVVDDGCDPPVADLLTSVDDERLRCIRIDHQGQAAALNAGIAAASGRWLRFADADDVVARGSLSHLAGLMAEDEVIAYGSTQVCDETLQPRQLIASTLQGDIVSECLLGQFEARHVSMLFPRRVIDAAGPWEASLGVSADWDFVLRALEHAPVKGDGQVATFYRRNRDSLTGRADIRSGELSRQRMIDRYIERHPEQRGSPLERQARYAMYIDRARAYREQGEYMACAMRCARAAWADPAAFAAGFARAGISRL